MLGLVACSGSSSPDTSGLAEDGGTQQVDGGTQHDAAAPMDAGGDTFAPDSGNGTTMDGAEGDSEPVPSADSSALDSSAADAGNPQVDSGARTIACGTAQCSGGTVCCAMGVGSASCTSTSACTGGNAGIFSCTSSSDCPGGDVCCFSLGSPSAASCTGSCADMQVCDPASSSPGCPAGQTCTPAAQVTFGPSPPGIGLCQ